jgi:hypothetical protein
MEHILDSNYVTIDALFTLKEESFTNTFTAGSITDEGIWDSFPVQINRG